MKQAEIQSEARKRLRALNIIGIDRATLQKAKEEIDEMVSVTPESIPDEGIPLKSIPSEDTLQKLDVDIVSNFCKVDMDVLDKALPTMDVYEQTVYTRLYRLSYGFGRNWCTVGYGALEKPCGMKRNGIISAIKRLGEAGWVKAIDFDRSDGTTYRVFLPKELGIDSKTKIVAMGIPSESIPLNSIPQNGTKGMSKEGIPSEGTQPERTRVAKASGVRVLLKGIPSEEPNIEDHSIDLSPRAITDQFYRGIGQQRISRQKRERAEDCIEELTEDGFSLENIDFAVEWTLQNAKEKLYDFSIIKHTIGQAMAAKEKAEEKEARRREKQKAVAQKEAEEKKIAEEESQIKAYKESLDVDERAKLRERAEAEIRGSGQYKEEFITKFLIEAKENELIGKQIGVKLPE